MADSYYQHKRLCVLNFVNHFGALSRTRLIELTDYRSASIGVIIKELLACGLLTEAGSYSSGHGRKRVLLEINKDHLCAIGIAFSSDSVLYTVVQYGGRVLRQEQSEFSPTMKKEVLADQIVQRVWALCQVFSDREIAGIGVGDPLYNLSYWGDAASYAQFGHWLSGELRPRLEALGDFPVRNFSAVTLPALVEQRYGAASGKHDFFCVELSNGIGCSICCNGTVVAGSAGIAGELGHTVVDRSDETLCYCGKSGCVEQNAAFPAISAQIHADLARGVSSSLRDFYDGARPLTVQDVRGALDEGDQLCRYYVKQAAQRIGVAIANAAQLLNPELIVLYGFMVELGDYFLTHLEETIRENTLCSSSRFVIQVSPELESHLPLGAAAEIFSTYLRIGDYPWIYEKKVGPIGSERESKG